MNAVADRQSILIEQLQDDLVVEREKNRQLTDLLWDVHDRLVAIGRMGLANRIHAALMSEESTP